MMKALWSLGCMLLLSVSSYAQLILTESTHRSILVMLPMQGEGFTISLENNGGTAYRWKLSGYDETLIKLVKEETRDKYTPRGGETPMVGTPYFTDYHFSLTGKEGETAITCTLSAAYEKKPAKTLNYTFMIYKGERQIMVKPGKKFKPLK